MGRRPNPIISKYFRRGDKIGDASNRYQYTCKKCGERFPKGRIDGLYNHCTKKCAVLSLREKSDLALEIHNHGIAAIAATSLAKPEPKTGKRKRTNPAVSAPQQQNFNRLNVLAEVVAKQDNHPPRSAMVLDPTLTDETFFSSGIEDDGLVQGNEMYSSGTVSDASISSVQSLPHDPSISTMAESHVSHHQPDETHPSQVASLTSIAASASATLADSVVPVLSNPVAEQRSYSGDHPVVTTAISKVEKFSLPLTLASNNNCDLAKDGKLLEQHKVASYPRPIAMNPDAFATDLPSESSQESSTDKPQGRSPFTEARRKEVQKMRQIGSCIRCRMLRKSCSEGTPCFTCADRNSSRNWKGFPCLRAKVVDLYQGYLLGLYQAASIRAINAAGSTTAFTPGRTKILVKYFESSDPFTLSALQNRANDAAVDSSLSTLSNGRSASGTIFIIDNEANDLPTILEEYFEAKVRLLIEHESSPIIKSAATHLHRLTQDSKDDLVKNILTLWMLTTMLSDSTTWWKICILQSSPQGSSTSSTSPLTRGSNPQSHSLISSQLNSTLEILAAKSYKHALHRFERRLCRLQSISHFETYLVAILLINCAERHSCLIHSWTKESKAKQWPLVDHTPATLIKQGEELATVLAFMCKVRYLNAGISETTTGGVLEADHPNDKHGHYAKWFQEIDVTVGFLEQRQEEAVFDKDKENFRSLDLRYGASLLLPATVPTTTTTQKEAEDA